MVEHSCVLSQQSRMAMDTTGQGLSVVGCFSIPSYPAADCMQVVCAQSSVHCCVCVVEVAVCSITC